MNILFSEKWYKSVWTSLNTNACFSWVLRCKDVPLSFWLLGDIFSDSVMTENYFNYSFNNHSEYYKTDSNTRITKYEDVLLNKSYFYLAIVTWLLSPFILSVFVTFKESNPFGLLYTFFNDVLKIQLDSLKGLESVNLGAKCLIKMVTLPLNVVCASLYIYVLIPLSAIILAFRKACEGETFDERKEVLNITNAKGLPCLKVYEGLGEALPQFLISVTFYANNYEFVNYQDLQSFPWVPKTVISIVFSLLSMLYGLYSGFKVCYSDNYISCGK